MTDVLWSPSAERIERSALRAYLDWLAERGFDPAYGARPLRRLTQKAIGDELARRLLAGDVRDGDRVEVSLGEDGESLKVVGFDEAGVPRT